MRGWTMRVAAQDGLRRGYDRTMIMSATTFQARTDRSDEVAGGGGRGERIVRTPVKGVDAERDVGKRLVPTLDAPRATVNPKDGARWRM